MEQGMSAPKAVEFHFNENSLESIDRLKRQGVKFVEIEVKNPRTGDEKVICFPDLSDASTNRWFGGR
jgi:hypothetical protein